MTWQPPQVSHVVGLGRPKRSLCPSPGAGIVLREYGEPRWWLLPTDPNDVTKEAIAIAVDRGGMLDRGDSVCLTGAGRELVTKR